MEVTGDVAANYYDLGEDVAAYKIYISTMYIGEEVAVLQVADSGSADAVTVIRSGVTTSVYPSRGIDTVESRTRSIAPFLRVAEVRNCFN